MPGGSHLATGKWRSVAHTKCKFDSEQCSFSISIQIIDVLAVMNDEKHDFGFHGYQQTQGHNETIHISNIKFFKWN